MKRALRTPASFHGGIIIACLAIASAWQRGQQPSAAPPSSQNQPAFKSSIEVVRLDVGVLDRDRRPIRDLTAADFVVLEGGKPQPIVDVVPVEVPAPPSTAMWPRDAGVDVASNEADIRRLVVIVMDDARTGFEHGESESARKIAHAIVDQLGPADLAAVTFTFMGTVQNLTPDRARLHRAIESYLPRKSASADAPLGCAFKYGGCIVSVLKTIGDVLQSAPQGRKLVLFIGSDGGLEVRTNPHTQMTPVQEMFRALQRANTTVYALDPYGVRTIRSIGDRSLDAAYGGNRRPGASVPEESSRQEVEDLQAITDATGGRTVAGTNTPEGAVPGIFQENSFYYVVGFRSEPSRTPRDLRKVVVRVNRPDAVVQTRTGYFTPVAIKDPKHRSQKSSALETVLGVGIPDGSVPIRFSAAPFAVPGRRATTLVLATRVRAAGQATEAPIKILAAAFDRNWKERGVLNQSLEASGEGHRLDEYETVLRMPIEPGRYEVRLAAQTGAGVGSVFESVSIPDFFKEALALSGVLLERAPGSTSNRDALSGLAPVIPTAVREFVVSDQVTAFVRIYQKGNAHPTPVSLSTQIQNSRNEVVMKTTADFPADLFAEDRQQDCQMRLPLDRFSPGAYLLTVEAASGDRRVHQDVRFSAK